MTCAKFSTLRAVALINLAGLQFEYAIYVLQTVTATLLDIPYNYCM